MDSAGPESRQKLAFRAAAAALRNPDGATDPATTAFLRNLGLEAETAEQRKHNARLLDLASRLNGFFRLDSPFAPNARFCGGVDAGTDFRPAGSSSGRGLTLGQAFQSCIGEYAELSALYRRHADPRVISNQDGSPAIVGNDLISGEAIETDAAAVLREGDGTVPSSTGCAAGDTIETAVESAFLECAERDAIERWTDGETAPRAIVPTGELAKLVGSIRPAGPRTLALADMTPENGLARCIVAISSDHASMGTAFGFAAAFTLEAALVKAMLELSQGEIGLMLIRRKLQNQQAADLLPGEQSALDRAARYKPGTGLLDFTSARGFMEAPSTFQQAMEKARGEQRKVIAYDLTVEQDGIPVVRVSIGGLRDAAAPKLGKPRLL